MAGGLAVIADVGSFGSSVVTARVGVDGATGGGAATVGGAGNGLPPRASGAAWVTGAGVAPRSGVDAADGDCWIVGGAGAGAAIGGVLADTDAGCDVGGEATVAAPEPCSAGCTELATAVDSLATTLGVAGPSEERDAIQITAKATTSAMTLAPAMTCLR